MIEKLVNEIDETFRNSKKKLSEDLRLYGETQDMINRNGVKSAIPWYVFADRAKELEDENTKLQETGSFPREIQRASRAKR